MTPAEACWRVHCGNAQPGKLRRTSAHVFVTRCAVLPHAGESSVQKASAFAAFAAAALLQASPASAGVILEQPALKKVGACTPGQSGPDQKSSFNLIWQQQLKLQQTAPVAWLATAGRVWCLRTCHPALPSAIGPWRWHAPNSCGSTILTGTRPVLCCTASRGHASTKHCHHLLL